MESGSKFSRKEFLGLLGTGAGALMLPGQISAADAGPKTGLRLIVRLSPNPRDFPQVIDP